MENYRNTILPVIVKNEHFDAFKEICIYAGKGKGNRKFEHILLGKKLHNELLLKKIGGKFEKIMDIWDKGQGLVVLHLFAETTHHEAHAREFALIKALKFINYNTNVINGTPYGSMLTKWNSKEILNYGNMLIYNALKMCISENPRLIMSDDVNRLI